MAKKRPAEPLEVITPEELERGKGKLVVHIDSPSEQDDPKAYLYLGINKGTHLLRRLVTRREFVRVSLTTRLLHTRAYSRSLWRARERAAQDERHAQKPVIPASPEKDHGQEESCQLDSDCPQRGQQESQEETGPQEG